MASRPEMLAALCKRLQDAPKPDEQFKEDIRSPERWSKITNERVGELKEAFGIVGYPTAVIPGYWITVTLPPSIPGNPPSEYVVWRPYAEPGSEYRAYVSRSAYELCGILRDAPVLKDVDFKNWLHFSIDKKDEISEKLGLGESKVLIWYRYIDNTVTVRWALPHQDQVHLSVDWDYHSEPHDMRATIPNG
jgi:hypothetical protein